MTQESAARPTPLLVSLGLIAVFPFFSVPVQGAINSLVPSLGETNARFVTEGAIWLYAAIVLAIALFWERRTLASIGLSRPKWSSLGFGLAGAAAMVGAALLAGYVVYGVLHQTPHAQEQAATLVRGSVIYAVSLAVRAGVIEEIFFRGLAIEQLTVLTGRRWLAALLSATAFVLLHALRFDWVQLVPIAAVTIVLTALYLWRRDLWANILAHVLVDGQGLVALALLAQGKGH